MYTSKVSIVKNESIPNEAQIQNMVHESLELLGGISSIVKKGDVVAIKGNFFAPYPPPVSVDRRTVKALLKELFNAGASKVTLCEAVSIGTKLGRDSSTNYVLKELGVADVALQEGAEVLCLEDDERIKLEVPDAKSIEYVNYPKTLYDCDVLIDLPCLKMHGMTLVTLGIKNFQGILDDEQKYYAHRDDLEQKLVDVMKIRKPDLTLVDGLTAMEGNGAGEAGIPRIMNMIIAGRDVVAVDAVGSACMGIVDPMDVATTRIADFDGVGCGKIDEIEIVGNSLESVKETFKYPDKYAIPLDKKLLAAYPNVDVRIGGACRQCWGLGWSIASKLSKFKDEKFTLLIGVDPKVAFPEKLDPDKVIVFGDCACAATGNVKQLRNKMLLEQKGCMAAGCPPYRQATVAVDKYLANKGFINPNDRIENEKKTVKRCYDYYKKIDPTWVPYSEQQK